MVDCNTLSRSRKLNKRMSTCYRPRKYGAIDAETTGVDFFHGCRPFYVSTCTEEGKIRCWQWDVDPRSRIPRIPREEIIQIQKFVDTHRLVFHNTKFDIRALESIGIKFTDEHWDVLNDTLVYSHVECSNMAHGLKPLSDLYLGIDTEDQEELRQAAIAARREGKKLGFDIAREGHPHFPGHKFGNNVKAWAMDMWLPRAIAQFLNYAEDHPWWNVLARYATTDAERTMALWQVWVHIMSKEKEKKPLYLHRTQYNRPLYDMETRGITFNMDTLHKVRDKFVTDANEAEESCKAIAESVDSPLENLGSFKQLQPLLFDKLGVPPTTPTKTGYSTKADELKTAWLDCKPRSKARRFITNLLGYNQRTTAVSYLNSYEKFCLPLGGELYQTVTEEDCTSPWYLLHPSYNLTGTRTTRQSSKWPNAQNISKKEGFNLRAVFGPTPNRVWFAMDYANIELRILAWESNELELMRAFEKGVSVHMLFAEVVCPEKIKKAGGPAKFKKTDGYRKVKNGDFSLTYGASRRTADATYQIKGAYDMVRGYFTNLSDYMDRRVSEAYHNGYVRTRTAGNEPGYPLYVNPRKAYTQAVDYICQGTAGWCMNLAVNRIYDYLKRCPDHHMIITIHDELVFDFPADHPNNNEIINECATLMSSPGADIEVPIPVECEQITTTWDKGVEYTLGV